MSIFERRRVLAIGLYCATTIIALSASAQSATAQTRIGAPAPAFALTDAGGRTLSLADFKGKVVVLEWTNHECPYVGKHYRGNSMQALQKDRSRHSVAVGDLVSARPAGACVAAAGEQAHGRPGRGTHRGTVRSHGQGRARVRRPHHPYVRDQRRRRARLHGRHRQQAHGAALPEERQEFRRRGPERVAGKAVSSPARAPMAARSNLHRESYSAEMFASLMIRLHFARSAAM